MTGPDQPGGRDGAPETAELVAQIRELAGENPADVQQVVADVLAALDRVTGGALGEQMATGVFGDLPAPRERGDIPPPVS
jgi:hypothetical protein